VCVWIDSSPVQRSSTIYGVAKQAEGTVMPKQAFSGELKKGEKYHCKGPPLGHPVEGHP